jgi:hypothetical protein
MIIARKIPLHAELGTHLQAFFEGEIDPTTGLVVNLVDIDHIMKEAIRTIPMTGSPLNFASSVFETIDKKLAQLPVRLTRVRVFRDEDYWVDFDGNSTA